MTQHDVGGNGPAALQTDRLGRRYGRAWGLRDCTLEVPAGVVAGLVGPNVNIGDTFTIITTTGNVNGRFAEPFSPNIAFIGGQTIYGNPAGVALPN